MLHIQIDPQSGVPVYRQVMDQVKYYAASGTLRPGALIPSIREMSKALSVNPTTIVKAYTELQHEGVIEMKQGKGAFLTEVNRGMSDEERRKALEPIVRQLTVEAKQMGASAEMVRRIVEEQLSQVTLPNKDEDEN